MQKGEQNQAIGVSRSGRSTKIYAIVDNKGRPLNFTVTGGQIHDSQVVGDVLDLPDHHWPSQPTSLTTARKYASRSRMKALCRSSPVAALPPRKPIVPSIFTADATKSKTNCENTFVESRELY